MLFAFMHVSLQWPSKAGPHTLLQAKPGVEAGCLGIHQKHIGNGFVHSPLYPLRKDIPTQCSLSAKGQCFDCFEPSCTGFEAVTARAMLGRWAPRLLREMYERDVRQRYCTR
jgi:hypothetical protein